MYDRFDGFTSTFQDKLFRGYNMEIHNQIFYTTLCSCILSLAGKLPIVFSILQNFEAFWNLPLSLLWHILEDALHGKHHGVFLDITIFTKWNLSMEVLNQSINLIHAVVHNWPGWASFTLRQNWFRSFFLPCRMHNHVWLSETFLDSDILLHSMDVLKNLEIWIGPWNAKNRCFLLHKRNLNSENCTSLGMQLEQ